MVCLTVMSVLCPCQDHQHFKDKDTACTHCTLHYHSMSAVRHVWEHTWCTCWLPLFPLPFSIKMPSRIWCFQPKWVPSEIVTCRLPFEWSLQTADGPSSFAEYLCPCPQDQTHFLIRTQLSSARGFPCVTPPWHTSWSLFYKAIRRLCTDPRA